MGIPESQLDTWSHQGSITQSASTYNTIKNALESTSAKYHEKNFKVFLQGSYGNNTNIYAESDVDVVIKLDDVFYSDTTQLSPEDKKAYDRAFVSASYSYEQYKQDVIKALTDCFGSDVKAGGKAIEVAANGNRRKTDIIASMQFRRYSKFKGVDDSQFVDGICFFNGSGELISNYPAQHSENLTLKHQNSNEWLKPMIRILKNIRSRLVTDGKIKAGLAPSYYLEGLLYNVPNEMFKNSYTDCFFNAMNWIQTEADKDLLLCANEQYYLLWEGAHTSWEKAHAEAFLEAALKMWNEW